MDHEAAQKAAPTAVSSPLGDERGDAFDMLVSGANQAGGRAFNERLAMSLIRLNGPLTRAELARLTGLTPQTLSHIVRRLEDDHLLTPLAPLRGRIGQPSTPYGLNPDGAFSFGAKIGRRSTEVVLCDLVGAIRAKAKRSHAYPEPSQTLDFVTSTVQHLREGLVADQRVTGLGVAIPFDLWKWADEVNAPAGALDGWKTISVPDELEMRLGLPTFLANDATAACGAELARNPKSAITDGLYIFIGSFVGGGVILNGSLYPGRSGNAGAIGSMPIVQGGRMTQLVHAASLITLERVMIENGQDPAILQQPDRDWSAIGASLERWIGTAAECLATAILSSASVIDFQRVTIDGAMPPSILENLVKAVVSAKAAHSLDGLSPFEIEAGGLGSDARALGGAFLPLASQFFVGPDVISRK